MGPADKFPGHSVTDCEKAAGGGQPGVVPNWTDGRTEVRVLCPNTCRTSGSSPPPTVATDAECAEKETGIVRAAIEAITRNIASGEHHGSGKIAAQKDLVAMFGPDAATDAASRRARGAAVRSKWPFKCDHCRHPMAAWFGQRFSCNTCDAALFEVVGPARIAREEAKQAVARAEDAASGDAEERAEQSFNRAVPVEVLLAITEAHDCWNWTTDDVQRYIIKPMCEDGRCRFVDLPFMAAVEGMTGPADVFASRASLPLPPPAVFAALLVCFDDTPMDR